jgi:tetratricopeptide (TPR) repeat protein
MSTRTRTTAALSGALVASLLWQAASADDDVVYLKSPAPGGAVRTLAGEVAEYTGRELTLRSAAGRQRTIPASQIERVETAYCAEQRAGDALFAKRDYRRALEEYRQALTASREPRDWVRRQILAQIVWCQRNLGQADQAGEYFLILLASDPYTRLFDCIPLAWTPDAPPPATTRKAAQWLDSKNPAAELIGASQLLATAAGEAAAIEHLKKLSADPDQRIAWLAQAQLWRTAVPAARTEQTHQWAAAIRTNDPALAGGAYFVLGSALLRHEPEEAALALLKVPILYERDDRLAAAALLAAGECLEKVGRGSQAAGLYRELAGRYPQAAQTAEARRRLASLERARDNNNN